MIKLVAVGKMKNRFLASLCADYAERLGHFDGIEIVEIKDSTPEREGEKILDALKGFRGRVYAMSEEGKQFDSRGFSKRLEEDLLSGGSAFAVGGPYGLSADVKGRADVLMSMSNMTFTHEFARAILLEQIYRAKTISANTGYHH